MTLSKDDLAADARGQAIKLAQEFLQRFGLQISDEILAEPQDELGSDT